MIFSELYGAYYNAVAAILRKGAKEVLTASDMRQLISDAAYGESAFSIVPALTDEKWQLMKDGRSVLKSAPTMPLTTLQKRWMKAVSFDPRIKLFTDGEDLFPDVEPLFRPDDVYVFDAYEDGDPYDDEGYIKRFRMILHAVNKKKPLSLDVISGKGRAAHMIIDPERLEYSEKDDKFRLIGAGNRYGGTVNLARIVSCRPFGKGFGYAKSVAKRTSEKAVEFEVTDDRNALERSMLHFAHFEKSTEKISGGKYRVTLRYDKYDETEILIRILSFGPMIKVTSPDTFIDLVRDRLKKQKSCGLS